MTHCFRFFSVFVSSQPPLRASFPLCAPKMFLRAPSMTLSCSYSMCSVPDLVTSSVTSCMQVTPNLCRQLSQGCLAAHWISPWISTRGTFSAVFSDLNSAASPTWNVFPLLCFVSVSGSFIHSVIETINPRVTPASSSFALMCDRSLSPTVFSFCPSSSSSRSQLLPGTCSPSPASSRIQSDDTFEMQVMLLL